MTEAGEACGNSRLDAKAWARKLQHYGEPDATRSACELAITSIPLRGYLVPDALGYEEWAAVALRAASLASLRLLSSPVHHSARLWTRLISGEQTGNDWIGRVISVLTLTPYHTWRRGHAIHHATSGNLDRRGIGDVDTLTVAEYLARSRWGRLRYRLYRHPMVMLGVGPLYLFVLRNRLPIGFMRAGWKPWFSTMATNVAIAAFIGVMIWAVGIRVFSTDPDSDSAASGAAGIWLFLCATSIQRNLLGEK